MKTSQTFNHVCYCHPLLCPAWLPKGGDDLPNQQLIGSMSKTPARVIGTCYAISQQAFLSAGIPCWWRSTQSCPACRSVRFSRQLKPVCGATALTSEGCAPWFKQVTTELKFAAELVSKRNVVNVFYIRFQLIINRNLIHILKIWQPFKRLDSGVSLSRQITSLASSIDNADCLEWQWNFSRYLFLFRSFSSNIASLELVIDHPQNKSWWRSL